MRLDGQGETSSAGGPAGALILTLLVKTAEKPSAFTPPGVAQAEATVLTANPAGATDAPTVSNTGQQGTVSNATRSEMRTPPSHSLEPTEQALPTRPAIGRIDEMPLLTQEEQQASGVPAHRAAESSETVTAQRPLFPAEPSLHTAQPPQRGVSRRTVFVGLAGLTVVGVVGGGLVLLARSQQPSVPATLASPTSPPKAIPSPTPTPSPSPTPFVGSTLYTYTGHFGQVNTVAWSPDGKRIASGSGNIVLKQDTAVHVWDAVGGGHAYTYHGHTDTVLAVAWSPDSRRTASGGYDKTVQVWLAKL